MDTIRNVGSSLVGLINPQINMPMPVNNSNDGTYTDYDRNVWLARDASSNVAGMVGMAIRDTSNNVYDISRNIAAVTDSAIDGSVLTVNNLGRDAAGIVFAATVFTFCSITSLLLLYGDDIVRAL